MNRRKEGGIYESLAADYLQRQGYKIVARNYHNRYGELDLIAVGHKAEVDEQDLQAEEESFGKWKCSTKETISAGDKSPVKTLKGKVREIRKGYYELPPDCFLLICEVKYKRTLEFGDPEEAVTRRKIRHICRTTMGFYIENGLAEDFPCRFDVISFGDRGIRHIKDAFPFTV